MPITAPRKSSHKSRVYQKNYQLGYKKGYEEGCSIGQGSFNTLFEGTSIIIPTYNKVNYLRECIDSIQTHTDTPYEIIVVDNASTDETVKYLLELTGEVRYAIHDKNRGFSGAVNTGLMMAKGKTIVILNNDVLVTPNWLRNMLTCLFSDERIGIVGPITNYISGEQKIEAPYETIEEMFSFAVQHNVPDHSKWQYTDRLLGFCLLFRRNLLEQTGYLDEGFEIGNFEDDDWTVRVRLQGKSLVICRDVFIHHYGSVSIKELGYRFKDINDRNQSYFSNKWGNVYHLLHRVKLILDDHPYSIPPNRNMTHFYPSHVIVQGIGDRLFWIEGGSKHLIQGDISYSSVRISQFDLRNWENGPEIAAETVLLKLSSFMVEDGSGRRNQDGQLLEAEDGSIYQILGRQRRLIINPYAAERWILQHRSRILLANADIEQYEEGLPIIAPPQLKGPF